MAWDSNRITPLLRRFLSGTCMDARGIADSELCDAARRSSLDQLTDWTMWADKVLVF